MEAVLAFGGGQPELLPHDLLGGVVRELEIVGAGHHTGQIVVGLHLWRVKSLLHNRQRWSERFIAANGKSGTARDKLEERSGMRLTMMMKAARAAEDTKRRRMTMRMSLSQDGLHS